MERRFGVQRCALSLLAAALLLGVAIPASAASGPQAVVAVAALNVRRGPATTYQVIDVVHAGDSLAITGRNTPAGWFQVSLPDGRSGWVSGSLVRVTGDARGAPEVAAPAAATGAAASRAGQRSANGGVIVFQVGSGGAIYAVNPDGSGLRYLTSGMDPALSPDGRQVAFTRWNGSADGVYGGLWVINVDGSGERQVLRDINQPKSPTWSAGGQQIVINMQQGGTVATTYLCSAGPGEPPVKSPNPIPGMPCMPQPADPHWGLRLVDVASGSFADLPRDAYSMAPTWDPANAWHVVFRGERGLMSLDLNQKTTWLLKESGAQRGPVFSPDGAKIATTFKQNDHWEVHVMNADGSGEVRLTQTPLTLILEQQLQGKNARSWNNAAPAWSPDGSQIAFLSDRNGPYEIWVMNADGSGQHLLVPSSALGGASIQYEGVDERVISWR